MNKDLRNLIFLYTNTEEYYKLKQNYKLNILFYCNNVKLTNPEEYICHVAYYSMLGRLDVVKYLVQILYNAPCRKKCKCMRKVFSYWTRGERYMCQAIDLASSNGYLSTVRYLHSIKKECTHYAMDYASANGHLDTVKYLHSIGKDCTTYAMDRASSNGYLDIVDYLHSIGKDYTKQALISASANGHLDIVKYLCSPPRIKWGFQVHDASREAANIGRLDILMHLRDSYNTYEKRHHSRFK